MDLIHESMTVHGLWCGERILGRLASARPMFPKRSAGSSSSMPWSSEAGPVKPVPTAVASLLAVWYCLLLMAHPSSAPHAFARSHCIAFSLGACGSSHHKSRLRYLALAPACALVRAAAYSSQCVISWSPPPPPPYTTHFRASITYRDLDSFETVRPSALLAVSEPTLPLLVFPLVCPPHSCWL